MENDIFIKRKKRGFPLIRLIGSSFLCFFIIKFVIAHINFEKPLLSNTSINNKIDISEIKSLNNDIKLENISVSYIVKPGDSFYTVLKQFGINSLILENVIQSLKKIDFHTLYPSDSIIIHKNEDNSIFSIDFFNRFHKKYSVKCENSGIIVNKEELPIIIYTYLLNTEIITSLSESIYSLGVSDAITANMSDIFAWDINFFLDPRKNDSFQVIFEKKVINGKFAGYGNIVAAKYTSENKKTYNAYCMKNFDGKLYYYDTDGKALQKQFLKAPLSYSRISSTFSYKRKHPVLGIVRPHLGVDYAAPAGTPVYAAADGKVYFAGNKHDYGKLVILSHGGLYQTYYGHLQSFAKNIVAGKQLKQGDLIGKVGSTGLATGPHLDYRIQKNGKLMNPVTLVSPSLKSVKEDKMQEFLLIKKRCDLLFQNRFQNMKGCFLLDISKPQEDTLLNKDKNGALTSNKQSDDDSYN